MSEPHKILLNEDPELAAIIAEHVEDDALPHQLLLYRRSLPFFGTDVECAYRASLDGIRVKRETGAGILVFDDRSGRLVHMHPHGRLEDDPYQAILDLIRTYETYGAYLIVEARSLMHLIGDFLELFWIRNETRLRKALLPTPALS